MAESLPTSTKGKRTSRRSTEEPICSKKPKLTEPVRNLEDYTCQKHDRPLEFICRDDQTYVCSICSVKDHKNHNTVPLEEESKEKTELMKTHKDMQQKIQDRIKKIQDIKTSAEINSEKDLIRSIERWHTEQLKMMQEHWKAAEKQEEELIKELEQEITELKMRDTELEQLSHTEDHLLQIYSTLQCRAADTRNWPEISLKNLYSKRRAFNQLKDTIEEKLTQTELNWMQQYAVDVTLDPDTAHPELLLSDDGKQVKHGDIKQKLPDTPQRFDKYAVVLGKEGFSSGRFYYEVLVKGKTKWDLGVANESVDRKGELTLCPEVGFWTVWLRNENEYKACADSPVSLSVKVMPQRVGVFVDYEEGLISFYDVESSSHIYSYTGQTFTGKLSPYFNPCLNNGGENSAPLIITPVNYK